MKNLIEQLGKTNRHERLLANVSHVKVDMLSKGTNFLPLFDSLAAESKIHLIHLRHVFSEGRHDLQGHEGRCRKNGHSEGAQ